jgi:inner membrane protein
MDPVTHGLIGLGIASLSGQALSISNPVVLGSMLGAVAPDFDIVMKYKGDYEYLKHHRGLSHSFVGTAAIAFVISSVLSLIFNNQNFIEILIWTYFGCLSHIIFDMFNSYGVRCLLPFSKRKVSLSLLMMYDPFISVLCIGLILSKESSNIKGIIALVFTLTYLFIRYLLRIKTYLLLNSIFNSRYKIMKINILPSMINPFKWDFVIETDLYNIVGEINSVTNYSKIKKKLKKTYSKLIEQFNSTKLGKYFMDFTPIRHFRIIEEGNKIILQIIDLRYLVKDNFMHHATIEFSKDVKVTREFFHPFNYNNKVPIRDENAA